ncbi:MAG: response regulator [Bacteroidota bacterium]|nr:response regulator [Bacteroidota bacterium]
MAIKKILIAEDEILVGRVLKIVLEQKNFEVIHVVDEESAIAVASDFKPDLLIMDVFLKNKTSGLNAGRQIRKNGIFSPILFTTGNSYDQTKKEILNIENSHLFIKPVDIDQLLKYIETTF